MEWITLDTAIVTAHLPSDLAVEYQTWLVANPGKSGRLAEIVANTVAEVRDNIRSNPANTLDADESKVPQSCVRHAENIIFFQLAMEMGLDIDTEGNQSMTRADIFLRQISFKRFTTSGGEAATAPSPSYSVPESSTGRALPLLALIVLLFAPYAQAGWVANPRRASVDTEIQVTVVPQHYAPTATTLFGHLQGIDNSFADWAASIGTSTSALPLTGGTMSGPLTNAIGLSTYTLKGYDQSQPTFQTSGQRLQPLTIKGESSRFWGPYYLSAGDVIIKGGDATSYAESGRVILSNVLTIVFSDGTTFNSADNIPKLDAITSSRIQAAGTNTQQGVSGTFDDLYIYGKNGVYAGFYNHYASGITLVGGTNPPAIGDPLPKPVTIINAHIAGGVASNLIQAKMWLNTNAYLTSGGTFTSLFFVTLQPPATNQVSP